MSVHQEPDLTDLLDAAERVPVVPRMPPADLAIRIKTSPWLRQMMPTGLLVRRAEHRGEHLWKTSPVERDDALATMESIIGATSHAQKLTEIAKQYLIERQASRTLFWQPWRTPRIDAASEARLRSMLTGSRAVIQSACHQGPYHCTSLATLSLGYNPYVVAGDWYFEPPSHDLWGRRLARWRKGSPARLVNARGSFPVLRILLERGECVLLYYDMPGRRTTSFLGKSVSLADGTSRLAMETDALVLPVRVRRAGQAVWLDAGAALDARDFADVEDLHRALARFHERWILEYPARMDDPNRFGWQGSATRDTWDRPEAPSRSSGRSPTPARRTGPEAHTGRTRGR
jgi:lauroyl/myristoyl acyltransferase